MYGIKHPDEMKGSLQKEFLDENFAHVDTAYLNSGIGAQSGSCAMRREAY